MLSRLGEALVTPVDQMDYLGVPVGRELKAGDMFVGGVTKIELQEVPILEKIYIQFRRNLKNTQ